MEVNDREVVTLDATSNENPVVINFLDLVGRAGVLGLLSNVDKLGKSDRAGAQLVRSNTDSVVVAGCT